MYLDDFLRETKICIIYLTIHFIKYALNPQRVTGSWSLSQLTLDKSKQEVHIKFTAE